MDWKKIINDIEASGISQAEIAKRANCSQPYISQLKSGARKSCAYPIGLSLTEMHKAIDRRAESDRRHTERRGCAN